MDLGCICSSKTFIERDTGLRDGPQQTLEQVEDRQETETNYDQAAVPMAGITSNADHDRRNSVK